MTAHASIVAAPILLGPEGKSFVAPASAIDAWLDEARPGEACVYARATMLPRDAAGVMRARGFFQRGLVTLEPMRRWASDPRVFEYRMRRTGRGAPPPPVAPPATLSADERALLDYIEARAEAGQPMETNTTIAERLRWRDGAHVNQLLNHLVKHGAIRRQPILRRPFRIITVAATGLRTAGEQA